MLDLFMSAFSSKQSIDVGDNITNSVLVDSSLGQFFSRTFLTPTNSTTWTLSFWWKHSKLNTAQVFLSDSSFTHALYTTTGNVIRADGSASLGTSNVMRDPTGYAHVVISNNGTTTTISINGTQVASGVTSITTINSAGLKTLLGNATGGYGDGYFALVVFVDGQSLAPTSFGRYSAATGQWVNKNYTGTYGINGFKLEFKNASNLGEDTSGNGNSWTLNGGIVSSNQTSDAPMRNHATLNCLVVGYTSYLKANTYATPGAAAYDWFTSTIPMPADGYWYAEFTCMGSPSGNTNAIGIASITEPLQASGGALYVGATPLSYSLIDNGTTRHAGSVGPSYTAIPSLGNVGVALGGGKLWWRINGVWIGSGDPATGLNPQFSGIIGDYVFAGNTYNAGGGCAWTFNGGQRPFTYPIPTGFKAVNSENLADVAIPNTKLHFDEVTRIGNSTYPRTIAGLLFSPDFMWIKNRSTASCQHILQDYVRGLAANTVLNSDRTNAENSDAVAQGYYGYVSSKTADGYTLNKTGPNGELVNYNGYSFVDWLWRMGGSPVTNNLGSVSAQVSANTVAGQSIITYAAGGASGSIIDTVGHGLTKTPELVLTKNRDLTDNWEVGCVYVPTPLKSAMYLNLTNASSTGSPDLRSFSPTTVGMLQSHVASAAGQRIVMHCFHSVVGYSRIGTYIGNGSVNGPVVHCGFKPRFILIKSVTVGGSAGYEWVIYDTLRGQFNAPATNSSLAANTANTEGSNVVLQPDITATGFNIRDSNGTMNTAGATYLFYAIAEVSMKYATAR